jgi:phasin family protein
MPDDTKAAAAAGLGQSQARMREGMDKAMKTAEELMSFGQGNLEAVVKSGQIWAAGVQDLSRQFAASAQASLDETMSSFRALAGVRSLKEAFEIQASLTRSAVEKAVTESSRLADASFKLAEQAMAPLTARVSVAVETFAKAG